jgi:hypothetical protein
MFFSAHKHKRIADAVLTQVQPLLNVLDRFMGGIPTGLASDKYVLGFFCGNIGLEMTRASKGSLDAAGQGMVLFLVLRQLFPNAIHEKEIGDLLLGIPKTDEEFMRGNLSAFKIQSAASGGHELQKDPDYLAAREVVRRQRGATDFVVAEADEPSKIAGEMLRALYYQHVIDHYQKTRA